MNVKEEALSMSMDSTLSREKIRKLTKPLMEKRRRARINTCLNQLKNLVLEAMNQNTSHFSKLEKADILEMTVKHLCQLQRRHTESQTHQEGMNKDKFRAGYTECAQEVARCLATVDGADSEVGMHVLKHLSKKVNFLPEADMASPIHVPFPDRPPSTAFKPMAQQTSFRLPGISSPDASDETSLPVSVFAHMQTGRAVAPSIGVAEHRNFSKPPTLSNADCRKFYNLSSTLFNQVNSCDDDTIDNNTSKSHVGHIPADTEVWRPW